MDTSTHLKIKHITINHIGVRMDTHTHLGTGSINSMTDFFLTCWSFDSHCRRTVEAGGAWSIAGPPSWRPSLSAQYLVLVVWTLTSTTSVTFSVPAPQFKDFVGSEGITLSLLESLPEDVFLLETRDPLNPIFYGLFTTTRWGVGPLTTYLHHYCFLQEHFHNRHVR